MNDNMPELKTIEGLETDNSNKEEWGGWEFVSDMLDTPDKYGIYQTSKCYQQLYDFVVAQKEKARKATIEEIIRVAEETKPSYKQALIIAGECNPQCHRDGQNFALTDLITRIKSL